MNRMQKKSHLIYEYNDIKIVLPRVTPLGENEGTHFLILHNKINKPFWEIDDIKPIIECSNLALSVAWILIKDDSFLDLWANIQWNAYEGFNKGVNVLGRSPFSETWGKPVNFAEKLSKKNYSKKYILNLQKIFNQYFVLWKNHFVNIPLFPEGAKEFSQKNKEFLEAEKIFFLDRKLKKKKDVIWVNEKFILTMPCRPHLYGYHLQLFPRLKYWDKIGKFRSPWQLEKKINSSQNYFQIQGYLEMTAILFVAIGILREKGLNFYNPEIHFSGNWSKNLSSKARGGKLSLSSLKNTQKKLKKEKEKYLVGGPKEFQTVGHAHLYATFLERSLVKLPPRPEKECLENWKKIRPLNKDKKKLIKQLLQKNLTNCLENI